MQSKLKRTTIKTFGKYLQNIFASRDSFAAFHISRSLEEANFNSEVQLVWFHKF